MWNFTTYIPSRFGSLVLHNLPTHNFCIFKLAPKVSNYENGGISNADLRNKQTSPIWELGERQSFYLRLDTCRDKQGSVLKKKRKKMTVVLFVLKFYLEDGLYFRDATISLNNHAFTHFSRFSFPLIGCQ